MVALTRLVAGLAALIVTPADADPIDRWQPEIAAAARRCGVPVMWIERVMHAESGGRTTLGGRPIRSRAGAIGLMQLMPATWTELRDQLALGLDPDAPGDNIFAGACYLRRLYDRFGYPGLFAAYNAGPARYAAVRAGTARLPAETADYLAMVAEPSGTATPIIDRAAPSIAATAPPPSVFVVRRSRDGAASVSGSGAQPGSLFAIRRAAQ